MPLLPIDLDLIERGAFADPLVPPTGLTQAEVEAIQAFKAKIRSTMIYLARQLGAGATFPIAGRADFPDQSGGSAEPQEAAAWAQRVLASPNSMLNQVFLTSLYNDVDASLSSLALVVALGTTDDAANRDSLRAALIPLLPLFVKGLFPGR